MHVNPSTATILSAANKSGSNREELPGEDEDTVEAEASDMLQGVKKVCISLKISQLRSKNIR